MDEELGDLGSVRLVRRQRQDHLDRADQAAAGECGEKHAPSLLHLGHHHLERGPGLLVRERLQVVDGRTPGDAIGKHIREPVEMHAALGCAETADLDHVDRRHRGDYSRAS
jgi:hypothetical protein